jgi:16S rRNA (uracil1498-N3)-methyltransferase
VPEVLGPLPLAEVLAASGESARLRLVAATRGDVRPLLRVVEQARTEQGRFPELDLLIGPEGGLSPREVESAFAVGFVPIGLGPLVLRTEAACAAALAALWLFADAKA